MNELPKILEEKLEEKYIDIKTTSNSYDLTFINDRLPSSLKQCTLNHLIILITNHQSFNDEKINPFKDTIIKYLKDHEIDGYIFSTFKRKKFSQAIMKYNQNDKRLRGPSNTLHKKLINLFPKVKMINVVVKPSCLLLNDLPGTI